MKIKKKGTGDVKTKMSLVMHGDMDQLYDCGVFSVTHPKTLQWKVFFEIVTFL